MCLWIEDDGDWVHLADGFRKARKTHECRECKRTIQPGERYFFSEDVDTWAKSIVTYKMCLHCRALITVASRATGCPEAWYWDEVLSTSEDAGFMWDIVQDHDFSPGARFSLLRLWVLARRGWRLRSGGMAPLPKPGHDQADHR